MQSSPEPTQPTPLLPENRATSNEHRISVEATIVITERSRRTWWRRIADDPAIRAGDDERGRTMLVLDAVQAFICVPMTAEDIDYLLRADAGDAPAQDDIGQLFLNAGKFDAAIYWLQLAAQQNHPDAMQCLGRCYLHGEGVPKDDYLGVMWIAKAAAHGHAIAQAQIQGLHP
jgi:TPR repeat protein